MTWTPTIQSCDQYMDDRTGKYEYRAIRYRAAADVMFSNASPLDETMTVYDIGAGMTEFDYCLRVEYGWRGRYIPIDGGIDGTDLNVWTPPRKAHWFVALEILEHLQNPYRLAQQMQWAAHTGVIFSTPNPATTDVLGMDHTHVSEVDESRMNVLGFHVSWETFYGGVFSDGQPDSLFGVWEKP